MLTATAVKRRLRRIRAAALLVAIVPLAFLATLCQREVDQLELFREHGTKTAELETARAIAALDTELRQVVADVTSLADRLATRQLAADAVPGEIREFLRSRPSLYGVAVAWAPFATGPTQRLRAPLVRRFGQEFVDSDIAHTEDYTERAWYQQIVANGPSWPEPNFSEGARQFIALYGRPFEIDGRFAGVVTVSYTFAEVRRIVLDLTPGKTGYGLVVSAQGQFVVHPIAEYVTSRTSLSELAKREDHPELVEAWRALGESGVCTKSLSYIDEITGQPSTLHLRRIEATGWTLGVMFVSDGSQQRARERHENVRRGVLMGTALLFCLLFAARARPARGWIAMLRSASQAASGLLLLAIVMLWWTEYALRVNETDEANMIAHRSSLASFLRNHESATTGATAHLAPPVQVPCGVFLQSLEFSSSYNVELTGYIWQKYRANQLLDQPGGQAIEPGFVIPEAIEQNIQEAYRVTTDDLVTIGWYFEATARQNFDFARYPFDAKDVWLRLWHRQFYDNILLIPDLDGYTVAHPRAKPGIEYDFVLAGWDIQRSFFNYKLMNYNVNFGVPNYHGQERSPELFFTVILRRAFFDAFIANLVPLFVVASILFAVLLTFTRRESHLPLLGFNVNGVQAACASLFLTIVLAHIQLRDKIAGVRGITYVEYFYFIMYVMILLVSINAHLFGTPGRARLVTYKENLIARLAYWPTLLGLLLATTVAVL